MATVESFRQLLQPLIFYSKGVGVEIWTAPGKFVPASYYLSLHVAIYFSSTVFTLIKYSDDTLHMMKALITLGTCVQVYVKFIIGHKKASELKLLSDNIEQSILQRYENGKAEEIAVLQRTGRILWFIFRFMRTSVSSAAFGFFLYPVIAYYTTGELMPLFMIELPYYGWTTTMGLAMNMFCQANILVIGTMGAIMSDFLFFMYAMYAMTCIDIFIVHLRELETLLKEVHIHEKDCAKQTSIMRQKWIQCMQDHQQATRFLNTTEDIFGITCLAQVLMGIFTVCDGMLLVALAFWFPTYCFLVVMFVELSIYFVIGHFVELKIDEMYSSIISMPWYKLPVEEQKEFAFLMCRQQRPMMLTAYGFLTMNFESYMSVMKGLYQFFVMIMQYVE
uniref:Olfactory receptor Or69 n=1 Tax=Anopheles quadriannulatus TaxID=34691 RepID=A0A8F5SKQ2_ANOQN|nr:olfactory receptor Or69 [Anopheles quadriannulatus]